MKTTIFKELLHSLVTSQGIQFSYSSNFMVRKEDKLIYCERRKWLSYFYFYFSGTVLGPFNMDAIYDCSNSKPRKNTILENLLPIYTCA